MTTAEMITCGELVEFLDDYLDGQLSATQRAAFEAHLTLCPGCRDYLKTYRETSVLARAALRDQLDVPEQIPDELVSAILSARERD